MSPPDHRHRHRGVEPGNGCGWEGSEYWHLLVARIVVAVGEAVLLPGTVSLLADLFSPEKRGRAMGAFGAAGLGRFRRGPDRGRPAASARYTVTQPVLPLLGAMEAVAGDLHCRGAPGRHRSCVHAGDPRAEKRGTAAGTRASPAPVEVPVAAVKSYILDNGRTISALFSVGVGFLYMIIYGWGAWAPTFFVREFGWKYSEIGKLFGLVLAIAGPAGALLGTWLGDFWRKRRRCPGYLRVAFVAAVGLARPPPPARWC